MSSSADYSRLITIMDNKIKEYEQAKTSLNTAITECQADIDSLSTSSTKFADVKVKQTDIFEGEMANGVDARVDNFTGKVNDVVTAANAIITTAKDQIATIDQYISSYSNTRQNYESQRKSALAQEQAQAQARAQAGGTYGSW